MFLNLDLSPFKNTFIVYNSSFFYNLCISDLGEICMIDNLTCSNKINSIKCDTNITLYYMNVKDISLTTDDISLTRLNKINSYIFDEDKRLSYGAAILLNEALKPFNLKEKDIEISYNKYNKPYFKEHEDFHFNISHSKEMVIVVISSSTIGCDIEHLRKCDDNIICRYFSSNEKKLISQVDNKDDLFTRIWTIKESYFKNIGTGINDKVNSIDVFSNECEICLPNNLKIKEYRLDDYFISICYCL